MELGAGYSALCTLFLAKYYCTYPEKSKTLKKFELCATDGNCTCSDLMKKNIEANFSDLKSFFSYQNYDEKN